MRLKPFFYYFGSKSRIAKKYPLPLYKTIIEPFAGAAAYSLVHHSNRVILYDKYPVICGVWDYLIHASERDVMLLPNRIETTVDDYKLNQEEKWLIGFWLTTAESSPRKRMCNWARQGVGVFWGNKIKYRIARQLKYIRHWKVTNDSYENVPDYKGTWFIDPPYSATGGKYVHNQFKINYTDLGNYCMSRRGQVIVCERTGANWLPFQHFGSVFAKPRTVDKKEKNRKAPEAIWCNYEQGIRTFL
jgi:site-specific DNA-adenine methylase